MSVCRLLPPNLMLLFQSLLEALPQSASNSLGVYQVFPNLMHLPRPPLPNLALCSSAEVFLQRTGKIGRLAASHQELAAVGVLTAVTGVPVRPLLVPVTTSSCWMTMVLSSPPEPSVARNLIGGKNEDPFVIQGREIIGRWQISVIESLKMQLGTYNFESFVRICKNSTIGSQSISTQIHLLSHRITICEKTEDGKPNAPTVDLI